MNIRLIPLLLFAATSLLTLKLFDMVLSGESITSGPAAAYANEEKKPEPKAEQKTEPKSEVKTEAKPPEKEGAEKTKNVLVEPKPERPIENITLPKGEGSSQTAIEARIAEKRLEAEQRQKELDIRENLLKAAEQKLDQKVSVVKQDEDKQAAGDDDSGPIKIKNLVTMYETMKTKSAAAIFNTLDMDVMIEVVSRMKPQVTSQIMAGHGARPSAQKTDGRTGTAQSCSAGGQSRDEKMPAKSKAKAPGGANELPRIDNAPPH